MPSARQSGSARATAQSQLDLFIDRYSPEVARVAKAAVHKMRKRLPAAMALIYDNYNATAIGFSPNERASQIVFSIALYPRWVSLFFARGVGLPDPEKRLQGSGRVMRHIVLSAASMLDEPAVVELMEHALEKAGTRLDDGRGAVVIKSISAKRRPRRPPSQAR